MSKHSSFATILLPALLWSAISPAQERDISLEDLGSLVRIGEPIISPDGHRVVVVVSRADFDENRFVRQLLMVETETGSQTRLTHDRPGVRSPQFSPSGDRLAFLAAGNNEKPQIHVLPMAGGESAQITKAEDGVSYFAWRPDGESFAYSTLDSENGDAPEKVAGEEEEDQAKQEKSPDERHNRSFEVGDNGYLASDAARPTHLWLVGVGEGEARRLTSGIGGITTSFGRSFDWSADGKSLAVNFQPRPHSSVPRVRSTLEILDVESGERSLVTDESPPQVGPRFSADGRHMIFERAMGPEPVFNPFGLFLVEDLGEPRHLSITLDRDLFFENFMPDGESLIVLGNDKTGVGVWQLDLDGLARRQDLGGVIPSRPLSVAADGSIAFVGSEAQRPSELYVMAALGEKPRRLTSLNEEVASRRLGAVETMTWDGPDGFELNGVLVFPPQFRPDERYPLVLNLHGGPMGASTEAFDAFNQLLAAQGWIVFSPNYRGSSTQGLEFQAAVINDAGDGPGRDVMSGVAAIKARGIVDEDRVAVSGWSYGGYMTAWLTAHYQVWRAAVAGAATTDWFDLYNLSDINVWWGYGLGGSPWLNDNADAYWDQSPMKYAPKIRTPMLILSNTLDPRVPVGQSYKLYHALKDNGVPVKFVAYPLPGHFPRDPVHSRDVFRRWIDWIEQHFEAQPAPD